MMRRQRWEEASPSAVGARGPLAGVQAKDEVNGRQWSYTISEDPAPPQTQTRREGIRRNRGPRGLERWLDDRREE